VLAASRLHYADAIAFYSQSLVLREEPQILARRARLYYLIGEPDNALQDYTRAAAIDASNVYYRAARWDILVAQRKADTALVEADALVAALPRNALAQVARANVLHVLGRNDEARAACQASLKMQQTGAAYFLLARLSEKSAPGQVMAELDKPIQIDPALVGARIMRGRLLLQQKSFAPAADDLSTAVRSMPGDFGLMKQAAFALINAHRDAEALQTVDRLVAMQPRNTQLLNERCWLRASSGGDLAMAMADCNAALQIDPGYAEALDSRGFVHLRRGEYAAARADYDAALKLRPDAAMSLYGRAVSLKHIGQGSAAQQDIAAARKIQPDIDGVFAGYGIRL